MALQSRWQAQKGDVGVRHLRWQEVWAYLDSGCLTGMDAMERHLKHCTYCREKLLVSRTLHEAIVQSLRFVSAAGDEQRGRCWATGARIIRARGGAIRR